MPQKTHQTPWHYRSLLLLPPILTGRFTHELCRRPSLFFRSENPLDYRPYVLVTVGNKDDGDTIFDRAVNHKQIGDWKAA